jgi:hypothetical protein
MSDARTKDTHEPKDPQDHFVELHHDHESRIRALENDLRGICNIRSIEAAMRRQDEARIDALEKSLRLLAEDWRKQRAGAGLIRPLEFENRPPSSLFPPRLSGTARSSARPRSSRRLLRARRICSAPIPQIRTLPSDLLSWRSGDAPIFFPAIARRCSCQG